MQIDATTVVSTFITLAATFFAHYLRDKNGLSHGANIALALVAMILLFGLDYWLTADITGDLKHNAVVGIAMLTSLIAGGRELYVLWVTLDNSPSPLAASPSPSSPVPPPPPIVPSRGTANGD